MQALCEEIKAAWEKREGAAIFTTVSADGIPNSIYVGAIGIFEDKFVIADNYFDKTRANIKAGSKGGILFLTSDRKSFQVKGKIEYHESGPAFDEMKKINPQRHPGHAAAVLCVEEAYSGSDRLQ